MERYVDSMKGLKIKISIKECLLFILFFSFFKPGYMNEIPVLDVFFNASRVVSVGAIFVLFLKNQKYKTIPFIILCALQGVLLLSTVKNVGSASNYILKCIFPLAVYMICSIYVSYPEILFRMAFLISEILTYINLLTVFLFPDGLYKREHLGNGNLCWFLGHKNEIYFYFVFFFIVSYMYEIYCEKTIRTTVLRIVIIFSVIWTKAINASVALLSIVLLVYIISKLKIKAINIYVLMFVDAAIWFMVVIMQSYMLFSNIIANVWGKSLTLSGRTEIWSKIFELSKRKIWLGYGVRTSEQTISLFEILCGVNAHDTLLYYLNVGGIISVMLFILFSFFLIKKLYLYQNTRIGIYLSAGLFSLFLFSIFETQYNPLIFGIYAFIDHLDELADDLNNNVGDIVRLRILIGNAQK